jgi:hypothetical protein
METLAIHKLELAHLMLWVTLNEDYPKKPYLNIFFLNPGTTRCVAKSCLPKDLT